LDLGLISSIPALSVQPLRQAALASAQPPQILLLTESFSLSAVPAGTGAAVRPPLEFLSWVDALVRCFASRESHLLQAEGAVLSRAV
jgi:hypothetical protein